MRRMTFRHIARQLFGLTLSFTRFSRALCLSVLVVMLGGLLEPEAAAQTVSFGAKTDFGTGNRSHSVAVGDFNGDGTLDLAVANENSSRAGSGNDSGTVSILLGTGTGSFGAKTDFSTGRGANSVAVGDFNGDGKLDLAVATDVTVLILLGTGTGSFGAKTDFGTSGAVAVGDFNEASPISFPALTCCGASSVAVGDFNGDGNLDLAVPNGNNSVLIRGGNDTVSILLGTGTGSFGAQTEFGTGSDPGSVAVGDFNGDGKLDLAVANYDGATVSILLGTGTGSFGAKTDFGTGIGPSSVAVGDFNGDGKLDLAVANPGFYFGDEYLGTDPQTVSILLGTGTGSFGAKTDFVTSDGPFSVAVGDFNGDGKLDLAVANFIPDTVSILPGTGTGSFGAKTDFGTGFGPMSVAVGDLNGDGKLDLAVANVHSIFVNDPGPNTVSILLNTGTLPNPMGDPQAFVRQHYRDFLSRDPDVAGLAFWTNEITSCGGDAQCAEVKHINVSAAFFKSIEFQETGYLVYKTYATAFGPTRIASTVPLTRSEFLPDVQSVARGVVVGARGWKEQLAANQTAYFNQFVQRQNFVATYPEAMTGAQYVDSLNANAGGALSTSERDQLVNELSSGAKTRAQVLRAVVDDADFTRAHFNRAFVLMQYFGYLRRNPNDAPDNNFDGYNFWLAKLDQFNGNFIEAEMVKGFITSIEYRQRFGP